MSSKRSTTADDKPQRINSEVHSSKSMRDRAGRRSPVSGLSPAAGGKVPMMHSDLSGGQSSVGFVPGSFSGSGIPGISAWDFPFLFPPVPSSMIPAVFQQQFMHHGPGSIFSAPVLPPNFLPPPLPFAALYPSPGADCDISSSAWSGHGVGSRNTSSHGSSISEGDLGTSALKSDSRISRPSQFSPGIIKRSSLSPAVARKAHTNNESDISAIKNEDNDVPLSLVVGRRDNNSRSSSVAESIVLANDINCTTSAELSRAISADSEFAQQSSEFAQQSIRDSVITKESSSVVNCDMSALESDSGVTAEGLQLADDLRTVIGDESRMTADAAARAKIALPPRKRLTRTAEEIDAVAPGQESAESGVANSPSSAPNFRTVWKKFAAKSNAVSGPPTHRVFGSKPMYDCRTFFQKLAESKTAVTSKAFITGKGKGYFHRSAGKTSPRTTDSTSSPRVTRSQSKPKKSQSPSDDNDGTPQAPVRKSTRKKSANTRYEEYDSSGCKTKKPKSLTESADNSLSAETDKDVMNLSTGDDADSKCSSKQNRSRGKRMKSDQSDTSAMDDGKSSSQMSFCGDDTQNALFDGSLTENALSFAKQTAEDGDVGTGSDVLSNSSTSFHPAAVTDSTPFSFDDQNDGVPALPPKFRHFKDFKAKAAGVAAEGTSAKGIMDNETHSEETAGVAISDGQSFIDGVRSDNDIVVDQVTCDGQSKQDRVDAAGLSMSSQTISAEDASESVSCELSSSNTTDFSVDKLVVRGHHIGGRKSLLYRQVNLSAESSDIQQRTDNRPPMKDHEVMSENAVVDAFVVSEMKDASASDPCVDSKVVPTEKYSHSVSEMLAIDKVVFPTNKDSLCDKRIDHRSSPALSDGKSVASLTGTGSDQQASFNSNLKLDPQSVSQKTSKSKSKPMVESRGEAVFKPKHKALGVAYVDSLPSSPVSLITDQPPTVEVDHSVQDTTEHISVDFNASNENTKSLLEQPHFKDKSLAETVVSTASASKRVNCEDLSGNKLPKKRLRREEIETYVDSPDNRSNSSVRQTGSKKGDSFELHSVESLGENSAVDKNKTSEVNVVSFRPYLDNIDMHFEDEDAPRLIIDEHVESKAKGSSRTKRKETKSQSVRRSGSRHSINDTGPPCLEKSEPGSLVEHLPESPKAVGDENSSEPPLLERSSVTADSEMDAKSSPLNGPEEAVPEPPSSRLSSDADPACLVAKTERKSAATTSTTAVSLPDAIEHHRPKTKSGPRRVSAKSRKPVLKEHAPETDAIAMAVGAWMNSEDYHIPSNMEDDVNLPATPDESEPATAVLLSRCKTLSVVLEKMNSGQNEIDSRGAKAKRKRGRTAVPSLQSTSSTSEPLEPVTILSDVAVLNPTVPDAAVSDAESDNTVTDEYPTSEVVPSNVPHETSSLPRLHSEAVETASVKSSVDDLEGDNSMQSQTSSRRKHRAAAVAEVKAAASDGRRTPTVVSIDNDTQHATTALSSVSRSGVKLLIKLPTEPNNGMTQSRKKKHRRALAKAEISSVEGDENLSSNSLMGQVGPVVEATVDGRRVKLKLSKCLKTSKPAATVEISKESEYEFTDEVTSVNQPVAVTDAKDAFALDFDVASSVPSDVIERRRVVKVEGIRSRFLKLHKPAVVEQPPALDHVKCKLVKVGRQKWVSVADEEDEDSSSEPTPSVDIVLTPSVRARDDDFSPSVNSAELIPDISARRITESQKTAFKKDTPQKSVKLKTKKPPKGRSLEKTSVLQAVDQIKTRLEADEKPVKRRRGRPPKSESKLRVEISLHEDDALVNTRLQPGPVTDLPVVEKSEPQWRQGNSETIGGVPWLDGLADSVEVRSDLFGNDSFQTLAAEIDGYRYRNEVPPAARFSSSSIPQELVPDADSDSLVLALPTHSTFFIPTELERLMNALDISDDTRRRRKTSSCQLSSQDVVGKEASRVYQEPTDVLPVLVDMSVASLSDVFIDKVALDQLLCQSSSHHWTSGRIRLVSDCLDSVDDSCVIVAHESSYESFDVRLSDDEFSIAPASFRDTPLTCFADLIF